ncbi:uncharacterized protein TRAVEDRAFT_57043 [Trametes versicolor FP-101664 SS1]|uniref:uncharacterized protein n=1 Tax=Trametes versicolor (strain FP-101664) TaxID=717944 RepID=UPI0004622084|nr:uncharacterized protein TRAVEDRAFT_57043 [Trametes versicolor FP-101664 SS1]EIW61861.1 hypothetical protein TRAVEDRAFT_57043 [Trametes versicolor FP-101664 SS1]
MAGVNPNITRPLFGGDENPKQFWNDVEEYLEGCEEGAKCKRVARLWRADSAADVWYEDLEETTKTSWSSLREAFHEKWNKKGKHTLSETTLLELLQQDSPTDQEMVEFTITSGKPVPRLLSWWRKTNNLILTHRIPDSLAERFRANLKATVLREALPVVSDWKEFDAAIQAVNIVKLKERVALFATPTRETGQEKEKKGTATQGDQGARASVSVEDLIRAAQALNVGGTHPVSYVQAPASYYAQAAAPRWTGPPLNAVRARPQIAAAPKLPPEQRIVVIRQNALAPQPNTEEGRAVYEKQKAEWHTKWPSSDRPNEYRPYPLTPGTLPVASSECWKCGQRRHVSDGECKGPYVPDLENAWRVTAGLVEGDVKRMPRAAPVQMVGEGYSADTYGQVVGQVFYNGQWVPFVQGGGNGIDLGQEQGKD